MIQYNVIYLDMIEAISETSAADMIPYIQRNAIRELAEQYPDLKIAEGFTATLSNAAKATGHKFIMIIDEWDAPIREAQENPNLQKKYLEFLRSPFKNSRMTDKTFAAAYMTGILPIKKDGSQSAISDFLEYSMVKPRQFGTYVRFTENEVKKLCEDHNRDFHVMKQWYDGYSFRNRDDVLTLLIHLEYLTYDETMCTAHIPNEEIRLEFSRTIRQVKRDDTIRQVRESEQLISDTVHGNETAVAKQIERIHEKESPSARPGN